MEGAATPSGGLGDEGYLVPSKRHALLVSARFDDDGPLFYENLRAAYEGLVSCGFREEDITVLYADGRDERRGDDAAEGSPYASIVDGEASAPSVRRALAELAGKVGPEDELFLYVSDHGGRRDGVSNLAFPSDPARGTGVERIDEGEFAGLLGAVECGYKVAVFDECFAGGFADALGKGDTVAVAACRAGEYTYHTSRFARNLFEALADLGSDADGDGRVSLREAFERVEGREHTFLRTVTFTAQHPVIRWGDVEPEDVSYAPA